MDKTIQIQVEGMTCGNCALSISKILEKKGATHISANAASGEVIFSPQDDKEKEFYYDAIEGLGYKVKQEMVDGQTVVHHDHDTEMGNGNQAKLLIICAILTLPLLMHMFVSWPFFHHPYVQLVLAIPVFLIGLYTFLPSAYRSLRNGMPNMDVLIMVGAIAAFGYSIIGLIFYPDKAHDYLFFETAASIITLVMFGNWLEHKTVSSTTSAIKELSALQPQKARLLLVDSIGKETMLEVNSSEIKKNDLVLVSEGEGIPADGVVVLGEGRIDERMITGESEAALKKVGDAVVGGTVVASGNLRIKATDIGATSVLSRIIRMVQEAQSTKPRLQKLADKISAVFVPVVLGIALLTLVVNYFIVDLSFADSMMRAIAVLVISCPCAMGLATPAAVAVGLGRAAKMGILVKGADTLELMKTVKQIVFDKTGTLTTGEITVGDFKIFDGSEAMIKGVVSKLEQNSIHPIAQSVYRFLKPYTDDSLTQIEEVKGKGMQAKDAQGNVWRLGSYKWISTFVDCPGAYDLYLAQGDTLKAAITIKDELRSDAKATIERLKHDGYKTILLSGDRKEKCMQVARELEIDEVYAEHSPEEKNERMALLNAAIPTAMVGDGINDAPALAKATVGISLSKATQIAIQSANIILSSNKLSSLPDALKLGIYTEQTIKQNLFWAFFYNIIAIPVAAVGLLKPTFGAGIMALSDVVLILNSLRLRIRRLK